MKLYISVFYTMLIMSCSNTSSTNNHIDIYSTDSVFIDSDISPNIAKKDTLGIDSLMIGLNFIAGENYNREKSYIDSLRLKLSIVRVYSSHSRDIENSVDSASILFTKYLLNNIIPYWYGTKWDFEGHSAIPNKGEIACGYFVSTTLKDMGININRYKLAQQGPKNETQSIAIDSTELIEISNVEIDNKLNELENGIYFIGLDNHVGYLYIINNNSYFIHSNYIDGFVMIEKTSESEAFHSNNYYIAKITGNKLLMEKWLRKEKIQIATK